MKYAYLLLFAALWIVFDVAGCAPRPREHRAPTMSQDRTFEVEGEILTVAFEDLSKTAKQSNPYTKLSIKVKRSQNLADAEKSLSMEEISFQRPTKEGDCCQ